MKYLKTMLVILFLLLVVIVAVQNYGALSTPVNFRINLIFLQYESSGIPLSLVSIITFIVGMLSTGLYGMTERFRLKKQIKILQKDVYEKDKELNSLRNLPVTTEGINSDQTTDI